MKKILLALLTAALLCTGCAAAPAQTPPEPASSQPAQKTSAEEPAVTCRIVSGASEGSLLLADLKSSNVYRLQTESLPIDGEATVLTDGMTVSVCYAGTVLATFPAMLEKASRITVLPEQNGLASCYLSVLNDLWEIDSGLNSDITVLGVDLSQTQLSASEQLAVAWAFAEQHDLCGAVSNTTYEELIDEGVLSGDPPYYWEDGCLFSIKENASKDDSVISFDAQKWRSGLGAYFFFDCLTAKQDGYIGYQIGGEAIS